MIPKLVVEITTTRFFPLVVILTTRVVVKITTRVVVKITTHSYIVTLSYMVKDAGMRASLSTLPANAHHVVALKPLDAPIRTLRGLEPAPPVRITPPSPQPYPPCSIGRPVSA